MAYRVSYGKYEGSENGVNKYEVTIYADTAEDIPTASEVPEAASGSMCIVAEPFDVLILNNGGEWKNV